jgi:hypothetical protein
LLQGVVLIRHEEVGESVFLEGVLVERVETVGIHVVAGRAK